MNMMDFSRMIEKLRYSHTVKQQEKEQFNKAPKVNINIQYDKKQKDIGTLIKLNNLMKRLELIKFLIGDWKSSNQNKYSTLTEQIKYVQKKLELLDEPKILYFQKRADVLNNEVKELWQSTQQDPQNEILAKRQRELGHNKEIIDSLYKNSKGVINIAESIPNLVDRLQ